MILRVATPTGRLRLTISDPTKVTLDELRRDVAQVLRTQAGLTTTASPLPDRGPWCAWTVRRGNRADSPPLPATMLGSTPVSRFGFRFV